jgi:nucleoside phosphorylase
MEKTRLESPNLYTVGWIAALSIERAAATALLHDRHDAPHGFDQHQSDTNSYTWGRIGEHNVVIASLPAGVYGTTSAATTASNLIHSFPHIRIGLLVGIGGGIARPDEGQDIRLGDIVVSQPDGTTGGVVQYDFGKAKANGAWERKGSLDKPPLVLLSALGRLQAQHEIAPSKVPDLLQVMLEANPGMARPKTDFTYQGAENDRLFDSTHNHVGGSNCNKCDSAWEVERGQRESTDPEIHYGIIASGNKLIKDAATRDSLLQDTGHQCLCIEMEAAGLMDRFPCLVIRGICDCADSHKNDRWQRYAAATAAAFAIELLESVPVRELQTTQKVIEAIQSR